MSHCERLPNGIVVHVTRPLEDGERAALAEYLGLLAQAAQERNDARRAAMSQEERDAEDARVAAAAERSRARAARIRGET